jgi:beta-exotoxin I transport system ATP-binding protein
VDRATESHTNETARATAVFPAENYDGRVPGTPAIETSGLSKTYRGGVQALVGLDLTIERGEVFGFLGPNGAGKSTTIRLLLDLIRPTVGSARLLGRDSRAAGVAARRHVGYLPGDLRLYDRLTGREQLESLARLRGDADETFRNELVARFEVPLDRRIRELSKGNRQKLGLVQAFMHRPELLILDEPTGGLDPILQEEFRRLLHETVADGRTVFLSSHSLDEIQHVAGRVGIIRAGRLIDVDTVAALRERALRHVEITFAAPVDPDPFAAVAGVRVEQVDGRVLRLTAPESAMDGVVKQAARHPLVDLVSAPAELEEIFLELYREDGNGR